MISLLVDLENAVHLTDIEPETPQYGVRVFLIGGLNG
jgi:hypothetical protein